MAADVACILQASISVRAHDYSLPEHTEFTLILLYRDKRRVMERAVATTLRHELPQSVCLLSVFTVQCKVKQGKGKVENRGSACPSL